MLIVWKRRLKVFLAALAVAVLATGLLVAVAGAVGSSNSSSHMMGGDGSGNGRCGSMWNGSGTWCGSGMWGTGSGMGWLTSHPDALESWLQLRSDHLAALRNWFDTYKADPSSPVAQQVLHDLWTTFWNDMQVFYQQYGNGAAWTCPSSGMWSGWEMGGMMGDDSWDAHHMWGTGYGAEWMTSHPDGFGQWLAMRGRQTADASAWSQKYRGALKSRAAHTALKHMSFQHHRQVKAFFTDHGLPVDSRHMRYGAGGWMGLGGMWGGFGW